jgi:hypothetical protein
MAGLRHDSTGLLMFIKVAAFKFLQVLFRTNVCLFRSVRFYGFGRIAT